MKVAAKPSRSLNFCASVSSAGLAARSTLLRTRRRGARSLERAPRMLSSSSLAPLRPSTRNTTTSASCVLAQALPTIARSSRRRGAKIPGVSTKMIWLAPCTAMPRTSERVVCTFGVTMEIFEPTSALASVDLPTFGAPISATKPQRLSAGAGSTIAPRSAHPGLRQHGGGGRLLGDALGSSQSFGQPVVLQLNRNTEFRAMVRTGARELTIDRRRQTAALRPFLQYGFRIARRLRGGLEPHFPQPLHQRF